MGSRSTATVEQKNGQSRVNLVWSPADGGQINVLRNGTSFRPQRTMGTPKTRLEPTPEHSLTRSVRRIPAIVRMKLQSSFSSLIRLREGS